MYLKNLKILNFKNVEELQWEFSPKINAILGQNGKGKTNVLDAIHYLSFGKSFLNFQDTQNINFQSDFFFLEGNYFKEDENLVQLSLKRGQKKTIKCNYKTYGRLSDHVGKFPLVIISPYDRDLIADGSEVRRRFVDRMISQTNTSYLQDLIDYQKALSQRNALLKYFYTNHKFDNNQLSVYDKILIEKGNKIYQTRKLFIERYLQLFIPIYEKLSAKNEEVSIKYKSDLHSNDLEELLSKSNKIDVQAGNTTVGIHKDDLIFELKGQPIKKFGSQGQQKSFLIALKIAQLDLIKSEMNLTPILLLDDIFDKLDESRVEQLIKMVNDTHFGQIFLTDTHSERTTSILKKVDEDHQLFTIK